MSEIAIASQNPWLDLAASAFSHRLYTLDLGDFELSGLKRALKNSPVFMELLKRSTGVDALRWRWGSLKSYFKKQGHSTEYAEKITRMVMNDYSRQVIALANSFIVFHSIQSLGQQAMGAALLITIANFTGDMNNKAEIVDYLRYAVSNLIIEDPRILPSALLPITFTLLHSGKRMSSIRKVAFKTLAEINSSMSDWILITRLIHGEDASLAAKALGERDLNTASLLIDIANKVPNRPWVALGAALALQRILMRHYRTSQEKVIDVLRQAHASKVEEIRAVAMRMGLVMFKGTSYYASAMLLGLKGGSRSKYKVLKAIDERLRAFNSYLGWINPNSLSFASAAYSMFNYNMYDVPQRHHIKLIRPLARRGIRGLGSKFRKDSRSLARRVLKRISRTRRLLGPAKRRLKRVILERSRYSWQDYQICTSRIKRKWNRGRILERLHRCRRACGGGEYHNLDRMWKIRMCRRRCANEHYNTMMLLKHQPIDQRLKVCVKELNKDAAEINLLTKILLMLRAAISRSRR